MEVLLRQILLNIGAEPDGLTEIFINRLQTEAIIGDEYKPEKLHASVVPHDSFPKDEVLRIVYEAIVEAALILAETTSE